MLTDEQKRIASSMAWWVVNELGESERDPDAVSYFLSEGDPFTPDVAEEAAAFYNNMIKEYYYRNRVADDEDDVESIF